MGICLPREHCNVTVQLYLLSVLSGFLAYQCMDRWPVSTHLRRPIEDKRSTSSALGVCISEQLQFGGFGNFEALSKIVKFFEYMDTCCFNGV